MNYPKRPNLPAAIQKILDQLEQYDITPDLAQDIIQTVAWQMIDKIGDPRDKAFIVAMTSLEDDGKLLSRLTCHGPSSMIRKSAERILGNLDRDRDQDPTLEEFMKAIDLALEVARRSRNN